jgi:hypothetical protein
MCSRPRTKSKEARLVGLECQKPSANKRPVQQPKHVGRGRPTFPPLLPCACCSPLPSRSDSGGAGSTFTRPCMNPPPANSRTRYARARRDALRASLGGKCARCQETHHLQFDCITSTGPAHHGLNWRDRLAFYAREHERGNLQLLCPKCHVQKTLDEIAARHFHEARVTCPKCGTSVRVSDQLRKLPQVSTVSHPAAPAAHHEEGQNRPLSSPSPEIKTPLRSKGEADFPQSADVSLKLKESVTPGAQLNPPTPPPLAAAPDVQCAQKPPIAI